MKKGKSRNKRKKTRSRILWIAIAVIGIAAVISAVCVAGMLATKENAWRTPEELLVEYMDHIPKQEYEEMYAIHDKSFYSDSEVDPHQESMEDYVVQHITVENFKHQSSAAVYNILKELVIKKDIATGKITLVDWSQYGYKADWLRLVMDTTDKIKVQAELDIVIPHIDVNAEYTKANVMGLFKGITTKKEVVRYVFENTGIMLYAYLRGEEERREYLSGNIDINYFDYDDTHAKYSVGEIGNGMKYTIERASVVREIQAVEGSKLIFKKVLPLMGVEFVRYGMLTVVPFPFKYLREYIVKEEKSV